MRRALTRIVGQAALGVVAACSATPAAPASTSTVLQPSVEPSAGAPPARPAEPTVSGVDHPGPVPGLVAALHPAIFDASAGPVPGGKVRCLITIHDGRLSRDQFYAVVLFGGGLVATWTHSSNGPGKPFLARLTPEEDSRALGWLDEVARQRGSARDRFPPSATVIGISTRPGDRVETSYFATDQTPESLDGLVRLLKHRLEATNAP